MDSLQSQQLKWCLATADFSLQTTVRSQRIIYSLLVLWIPLFKASSVSRGLFFRFIVLKRRVFIPKTGYLAGLKFTRETGGIAFLKSSLKMTKSLLSRTVSGWQTAKTSLPFRRSLLLPFLALVSRQFCYLATTFKSSNNRTSSSNYVIPVWLTVKN